MACLDRIQGKTLAKQVPLSCYILTRNSKRRLAAVLTPLAGLVDDLLLVDSGSQDGTERVAREFGARFIFHKFENFRDQRQFALSLCGFTWVLDLDSDEVISPELRVRLLSLKAHGFTASNCLPDAFGIRREWFFLGQRMRCFFPSKCPDYPLRLYRRDKVGYSMAKTVHEGLSGHERTARIDQPILHYTCDSIDQMYAKVNQYSNLLALDMNRNRVRSNWFKITVYPWLLWVRFYLIFGGWRDGYRGVIHGRYVRDTVWLKYVKLKYDFDHSGRPCGRDVCYTQQFFNAVPRFSGSAKPDDQKN